MINNFRFDKHIQFPSSNRSFKMIEKLRSCQIGKEDQVLSHFINKQSQWKNKIKTKKKQIMSLKTAITNLETNHSLFIAIFALTVIFALVYLVVLAPLSLLGLALKAPIWWLGIMISFIGTGIGGLAIKSIFYLNQKKQELNNIAEENKHLKFLFRKRNIIQFLFNYDKLYHLNMITLSRKEHSRLIQQEIWHHPLFKKQIEHLEHALQYSKNRLDIPQELTKKIQANFLKYISF